MCELAENGVLLLWAQCKYAKIQAGISCFESTLIFHCHTNQSLQSDVGYLATHLVVVSIISPCMCKLVRTIFSEFVSGVRKMGFGMSDLMKPYGLVRPDQVAVNSR